MMLSSTSRMPPATLARYLSWLFLLSQCQSLPPPSDNVLSLPDTLLYVALTAEATSLHVSWAVQPSADPAGEYKVTWVDQHDHQGNAYVADKTNTILDGMKPCTRYTVSVTRVHTTGQPTTDSVEKSTTTQNEAPPAVTGLLSRDITARSLSLSWERPTTECEVTAYRIIYEGVAKWAPYNKHNNMKGIKRGAADNATEFKVDALQPYSDYTVMVVAYTSGGKGGSANITITTEQDVPEMPVDLLTEKPMATSITATWAQPAVANGVLGPYYVSWYRDGKRMGSERESLTAYTIAGLSPCVVYTIHVAASTAGGTGDHKEITQTTNAAAPPATADISCQSNEDQSVMMTWSKPDTACPIAGYKVYRPKKKFDSEALETADVPPSVLSANFSTQTGINFRACVSAVVLESLIGSHACCDQDTLSSVKASSPRELQYYKIGTFSLLCVVILLIALLFICWTKIKHIKQGINQHNTVNREGILNAQSCSRDRTLTESQQLEVDNASTALSSHEVPVQKQDLLAIDWSSEHSSSEQPALLPDASTRDDHRPLPAVPEDNCSNSDVQEQHPENRGRTCEDFTQKNSIFGRFANFISIFE